MNPNVLIAAIATAGSVVVAITALLLNYRMVERIERWFSSLERRLEVIESDLKEFFKILSGHAVDIGRLKDKAGLS
jgi:biopolymer transport protein ExbB/TolQ